MDFIIILLLVFFLLIVPFMGVLQLRERSKNQQLAYRLQAINRIRLALFTNNQFVAKKTLQSSVSVRNVIWYFLAPIPALFIIVTNRSYFALFIQLIIYFGAIFAIYFSMIRIRDRRYKKKFIEQFPNAIDLIIRNLRAGRTIIDAIKTAGEEIKGPIAEQFRSIADQVELGKGFVAVVHDLSKQLNIPEFTFFGIVLSVQQETGGNIIKTLDSLVKMLRSRQLMRLKIKALSAEGIISALIMGGLPFIVLFAVYLLKEDYISILLNTQNGNILLMISAGCELLGCLWILRILHIEV